MNRCTHARAKIWLLQQFGQPFVDSAQRRRVACKSKHNQPLAKVIAIRALPGHIRLDPLFERRFFRRGAGSGNCSQWNGQRCDVQYHLAQAYLAINNDQDALARFQQVVELTDQADSREFVKTSRLEVIRLVEKTGSAPLR